MTFIEALTEAQKGAYIWNNHMPHRVYRVKKGLIQEVLTGVFFSYDICSLLYCPFGRPTKGKIALDNDIKDNRGHYNYFSDVSDSIYIKGDWSVLQDEYEKTN